MIKRALIVTLDATSTNMEKTKYGPFHKDLDADMIFLWDIMHHGFGGTTVSVHA